MKAQLTSYLVETPHVGIPLIIARTHDKGILKDKPDQKQEAIRYEDGKVRNLQGQRIPMYNWSWKYK